jgi:hypothetical protein
VTLEFAGPATIREQNLAPRGLEETTTISKITSQSYEILYYMERIRRSLSGNLEADKKKRFKSQNLAREN